MSKQINIGGRLHSTEQGNVITGANEVLDDTKGKKQNVINADVDAELLRLDQSKQNNLTFDNTPTEDSNNPVKSSGVYAADKALSDAIEAILILIPSAATALNQLADKNFVNSSIATDTATFRGTSETGLSEAQFLEWANSLAHDMNDYVFWQTIDEAGNTLFKRYKWNGTQWLYEYTLNNSSFTADQWESITSGITTALVEKLVGLPTNAALQQALNSKQDALTFDNVPTEGSNNPVKSGGVYSAVKAEEDARLNLAQTVSEIGGDMSQIEDVIPTGATVQNKLVANASMEAYVASIIQNITASFTLSTADGHINITLTQVNGRVATLTLSSSDIASAQALTALTGRVTTAEGNITSLSGRVSTNETDIANLQQLYNDLQQSKPVPVTALPETGQQQGVIYRLAGTTSYSDYMWNGSTWVLMATYNNAIDPRPKKASQNLVTSGGVFDNMGALDVSELNATENPHTLAQYVDLSAALVAVPTDYQKGGMSIKFVQSSDNKYVQYRLMANSFTTDTSQWQGIADGIIAGSQDLAISGDVAKDTNTALSALGFAPKMYLGKWYSDTTGILWDSDTYDCTELIEVKGNDNFIYTNLRARSVACFDIDKQFLGIGSKYMTLLANTKYVGFMFLKENNYDYKTLNIRFFNNPLEYKDIANGLSRHILLNAAVNSSTGNLEYFDALDCTPKIKVGRNTSYLYMNAKYFDVTCWAADGTLIGSIKTNESLLSSRIGFSLKPNTAFVSVCFLKSENIDYDKLRIYSDEEEYKKELINNEGLIPHIYLGKAYNPSTGNLENFPNDLDCTNLIKVEGGINKYGNTVKVNQDVSCIFQIACFDSGYNLIGRTVGKSLKLLDNTAFFSISFLKNKNVDYTKLLIGIDVTNNIVIPTPKRGLKYYLFGDSITYYDSRAWAYDPDYYMVAYPSYIRDVLHAEISNDGVAGDPSRSITTRLLVKDLSDAYAVTYMAGTNDLVNNVPIGTLGTLDRDTYIGNLEVGLRYVLENYPQVKFYFIAPLYAKNRNITPYCEAMQQVANAYGIPIIRWDLIGGINEVNVDYFLFDGIHPNNKGHERFADALIPFLQNF